MIDLEQKYLSVVLKILKVHAPEYEVRVFGSRISGTAAQFSDLDLALVGEKQIDFKQLEKIKSAFSESNLPFLVDVVDWHAISEDFQKIIENNFVLIQKA